MTAISAIFSLSGTVWLVLVGLACNDLEVSAGSDLLGQTVAALAAIAIAFKDADPSYANTLEAHARDLYV